MVIILMQLLHSTFSHWQMFVVISTVDMS